MEENTNLDLFEIKERVKLKILDLLRPYQTGSSLTNPCAVFKKLSLHLPENEERLLEIIVKIEEHFFESGEWRGGEMKKLCKEKTDFFKYLETFPCEGKLKCSDVRRMVLVILFLLSAERNVRGITLPDDGNVDIHSSEWQRIQTYLKDENLENFEEHPKKILLRFFVVLSGFLRRLSLSTSASKDALIAASSFLVGCDGCTKGDCVSGIRKMFEPLFLKLTGKKRGSTSSRGGDDDDHLDKRPCISQATGSG
eukprot:scaffold859_cov234-Ochromonas_danica.AAC.7